jgi:hypothetical protein
VQDPEFRPHRNETTGIIDLRVDRVLLGLAITIRVDQPDDLPLPGPFPSDPSISTPTNTSPVGAVHRQAGQGVTSGPENRRDSSSGGVWAETESGATRMAPITAARTVKRREVMGGFILCSDRENYDAHYRPEWAILTSGLLSVERVGTLIRSPDHFRRPVAQSNPRETMSR